jgi:hypothetical protein
MAIMNQKQLRHIIREEIENVGDVSTTSPVATSKLSPKRALRAMKNAINRLDQAQTLAQNVFDKSDLLQTNDEIYGILGQIGDFIRELEAELSIIEEELDQED